jgi:hypothetical protein
MASPPAEAMCDAITATSQALPTRLRRTLTWDQGKKLALHQQITEHTGTRVFCCNAHSPWQRCSNETGRGLPATAGGIPPPSHDASQCLRPREHRRAHAQVSVHGNTAALAQRPMWCGRVLLPLSVRQASHRSISPLSRRPRAYEVCKPELYLGGVLANEMDKRFATRVR